MKLAVVLRMVRGVHDPVPVIGSENKRSVQLFVARPSQAVTVPPETLFTFEPLVVQLPAWMTNSWRSGRVPSWRSAGW